MIGSIVSRLVILVFGTLYPAYASYKAVRSKKNAEYLKWLMYWIVFAFFTSFETFSDVVLSWFPFYYEMKVVIVLWVLSPATEGSSVLYRNFVHPMLQKREKEIDEYISQAKEKGYTAVIQLGSKGVDYARNVIMQTALKQAQIPALAGRDENDGVVRRMSVAREVHEDTVISEDDFDDDTFEESFVISHHVDDDEEEIDEDGSNSDSASSSGDDPEFIQQPQRKRGKAVARSAPMPQRTTRSRVAKQPATSTSTAAVRPSNRRAASVR